MHQCTHEPVLSCSLTLNLPKSALLCAMTTPVDSQPLAPAPQQSAPRSTNSKRSTGEIGQALDTIVIPHAIVQAKQKYCWRNKLLLIFEVELRRPQVRDWILAYNQEAPLKLTYEDELKHSLYVVKLEAASESAEQLAIVKSSSLKAHELFCSVNVYHRGFDPTIPKGLIHCVTLHISPGSPELREYLSYIVQPIGRLLRGRLATGVENHRRSALVETQNLLLPKEVTVCIGTEIRAISFDYHNRNLRCWICFGYTHVIAHCPFFIPPTTLPLPPNS
jgi:hypothetical protein